MGYEQKSRRSGSFSIPAEVGKEYLVNITDTGRGGDGIARVNGFVIFVKNAKAGYKNVKIKINSVKDRFANAEIVYIRLRFLFVG